MAAQPFIAPSLPLDRRRLGKYDVLCRLSTGGMSEIFLATQSGLAGFSKLVVLKSILPDISGEEDFVRMFLDEARTTAQFNHPNIAQVFELDVSEGQLFMAMEFVQGCTLVEMARACRLSKEPIPVGFTLQAVRDTALALHYAHNFTDARGRKQVVIHRDVAEKNIMVTYEGVTKLLDFGIAKAAGRSNRTTVGMVKGTSGYMSPEQIRGEPLDGRSDIFALGVVMHECLTGMRLFHGKKPEDGMLAALKDTVAPPSKLNSGVSPEIDGIVLKSLSRNREERFSTALEMARAIEKAAGGAIWLPEQTGELVSRHFTERRLETRRLFEGASSGEATGEVRIESLLAHVKASQSGALDPPKPPPPPVLTAPSPAPNSPAPLIPPVSGSAPNPLAPQSASVAAVRHSPPTARLTAPLKTPMPVPPAANAAAASANSKGRAGEKAITTPARPRVDSPKPIALPDAAPLAAQPLRQNDFDNDDSEAKTIPAAALPHDIQALHKQLIERRQQELARQEAEQRMSTTEPGGMPAYEPDPVPSPPDPLAPAKNGRAAVTPSRAAVAFEPSNYPSQYPSGETQSVTAQAARENTTDETSGDFSGEYRTTIEPPQWAAVKKSQPPRRKPSSWPPVEAIVPSETRTAAPSAGKYLLIAIIVLSILLVATFVMLFAFDLLPGDVSSGSSSSTSPPRT